MAAGEAWRAHSGRAGCRDISLSRRRLVSPMVRCANRPIWTKPLLRSTTVGCPVSMAFARSGIEHSGDAVTLLLGQGGHTRIRGVDMQLKTEHDEEFEEGIRREREARLRQVLTAQGDTGSSH